MKNEAREVVYNKKLHSVQLAEIETFSKGEYKTIQGRWRVFVDKVNVAQVEYVRNNRLEVIDGRLPEGLQIGEIELTMDFQCGKDHWILNQLPKAAEPLGEKKIQRLSQGGLPEWSEDASLVQLSDDEANAIEADWVPYGQEAYEDKGR